MSSRRSFVDLMGPSLIQNQWADWLSNISIVKRQRPRRDYFAQKISSRDRCGSELVSGAARGAPTEEKSSGPTESTVPVRLSSERRSRQFPACSRSLLPSHTT